MATEAAISVDPDTLAGWANGYIWALARVGALFSVAPVLGVSYLPRRVRILLALVLTAVVMPLLPPVPSVDPLSPLGLWIALQQLLIGLTLGFLLRLAFAALELGGQMVAIQMGLGFANLVDPVSGGQLPLLGMFYTLLGSLIFLGLDAHLVLIKLVVESFQTLPIGTGLADATSETVALWAAKSFTGGLLIALPAVAALLAVNVAFGIMTRAAPQLNIFMVGFPISLLLGLFIIRYGLPSMLPQFQRLLDNALMTGYALVTP